MAEARAPAHQFEEAVQQREAATLGMWVFLLTEVMLFGGLFTGYSVYRSIYPETFAAASRQLDFLLGTINTAVLIASSFTMAMAVHAAAQRRRSPLGVVSYLALTAALGVVFLAVKGYEYAQKAHEGHLPGAGFHWHGPRPGPARLFFGFYFMMTGLHAFHLLVGVSLVAGTAVLYGIGRLPESRENKIEVVGLYWHLIDIIWIFLYPLLYLIDRSPG